MFNEFSLVLLVVLVDTRFTTRYHSSSFVVIPCYSLYLSFSLVVTQRITRLLYCTIEKQRVTQKKIKH